MDANETQRGPQPTDPIEWAGERRWQNYWLPGLVAMVTWWIIGLLVTDANPWVGVGMFAAYMALAWIRDLRSRTRHNRHS